MASRLSTLFLDAPRALPAWAANLIVLALIAAAWPLSGALDQNLDPYYLDLVIRIGIAVVLAVSLNLINGITGQFSLGHAGFMAVGAYVAGVLMRHAAEVHHLPRGPVLPVAMLGVTVLAGTAAAAAGLVVGVPTLRLRGDYLAIATLGFGEILTVVLNKIESVGPYVVGGSAGLHDIPVLNDFFYTFAWALACVVCVWRLAHSPKGRAFLAVREDEIAAAATGVDTVYHKVTAFVIGAFFAGAAGALSALWEGNLAPKSFNFVRSVEIVVMVVLGGSGSVTGSILAAAVLTYLPAGLRELDGIMPASFERHVQLSEWRLVIYSLLLISLMLLRPAGLLGRRELWWTRRRGGSRAAPPTSVPLAAGGA